MNLIGSDKLRKYKDVEIGDIYGRLKVIEFDIDKTNSNKRKRKHYKCICECGNEVSVCIEKLKNGSTQSCGCLQRERTSEGSRKYNKYNLSEKYGIGYTSKNQIFYFDLEDYYWYIDVSGYPATRTIRNGKADIKMHNLLMSPPDNKMVDHRDRKRNNNRRNNLFIVTRRENNINKNIRSDNTCGFIGVGYDKRRDKWFGYINLDGKRKYLGYCKNKDDAIRKRLQAELDIFGKELSPQRHLFQEWNIN